MVLVQIKTSGQFIDNALLQLRIDTSQTSFYTNHFTHLNKLMNTLLSELLDITIPVVQAPMGGAAGPRLAAAVSNAGGLGTLPIWTSDLETTRALVRETRTLTDKPFAVNLNMEFPQEERLEACLEEGAPAVSFFWQDSSGLVDRAKAVGATVMHTVASTEDARHAVDSGVDILIAQGWEAVSYTHLTLPTKA